MTKWLTAALLPALLVWECLRTMAPTAVATDTRRLGHASVPAQAAVSYAAKD
jgi:hypothetical protein